MPLPPLVEPGPPLRPDALTRYSRHLLLPGVEELGQRRLANAKVLVVGAGGLGSPALTYLSAAGVGTLGIVDDDVVDVTNLQRQVVHRDEDVGRRKVDSAADAVRRADPGVTVVRHDVHLDDDNAEAIVGAYDVVLDGADNFDTRYVVSDATARSGTPCVWASVLRYEGQVSTFWSAAPDGRAVTLRDVFPDPPAPDSVPSCAEAGVLGAVCSMIGSVMAAEAAKLILGLGEPLLGRVLILDALAMRWSEMPVRRDPAGRHGAPPRFPAPAAARPRSVERPVPEVDPGELASWLAERRDGTRAFRLVDVREPGEHALVRIDGDELVPMRQVDPAMFSDDGDPVVFYCKSGVRSAAVTRLALSRGVEAYNLAGGVLRWIDERDPTLPRY